MRLRILILLIGEFLVGIICLGAQYIEASLLRIIMKFFVMTRQILCFL